MNQGANSCQARCFNCKFLILPRCVFDVFVSRYRRCWPDIFCAHRNGRLFECDANSSDTGFVHFIKTPNLVTPCAPGSNTYAICSVTGAQLLTAAGDCFVVQNSDGSWSIGTGGYDLVVEIAAND
jgi:hypothetical protein